MKIETDLIDLTDFSEDDPGNSVASFNQVKEEQIKKMINGLLELPGQNPELWVNGLKQIEIFIYNKETVQVGDLD